MSTKSSLPYGVYADHMIHSSAGTENQSGCPRTQQRFDEFIVTARPFVRIHQFSLTGMARGLRAEILYVLQRRDEEGFYVDPTMIRTVIKKCDERRLTSLLSFSEAEIAVLPRSNAGQRSFLRSARLHLTRLRVRYGRQDAFDGDVWDAALLGLDACRHRPYPAVRGTLDFTEIGVSWVKHLVKEWVRHTEPDVTTAGRMIRTAKLICDALVLRAGGHDPAQLRLADMTAAVGGINTATRDNGELYAYSYRAGYLTLWRDLLEFGRAAGLMDEVPGEFAVLSTHRLDRQEPEEEKAGKSLPVAVIRVLDAHIDALRPLSERTFVGWGADDYALMYRTMYFLFRNTGRRLDEVMSLKRDCLRYSENGDPSLVYDNRKAKRLGRWLHIDKDTATVIERWQHHVDEPAGAFRSSGVVVPQPRGSAAAAGGLLPRRQLRGGVQPVETDAAADPLRRPRRGRFAACVRHRLDPHPRISAYCLCLVPVLRLARCACAEGRLLACPHRCPTGAAEAPGSRPAAGRRVAMRSSLEPGGAAP